MEIRLNYRDFKNMSTDYLLLAHQLICEHEQGGIATHIDCQKCPFDQHNASNGGKCTSNGYTDPLRLCKYDPKFIRNIHKYRSMAIDFFVELGKEFSNIICGQKEAYMGFGSDFFKDKNVFESEAVEYRDGDKKSVGISITPVDRAEMILDISELREALNYLENMTDDMHSEKPIPPKVRHVIKLSNEE